MKIINFFIILIPFLLETACHHPEATPSAIPARFNISAARMLKPPDSSFRILIDSLGKSPEVAVYPQLKGIPDSLHNIKKYIYPVDYIQAVFQAYKSGLIEKDFFLSAIKRNIDDTVFCSADYVKTFIAIVTGVSKKGQKYYLVDSDNNYDFSDEPLYILTRNITSNQPYKVIYEKFVNERIEPDSTWVAFYEYRNADPLRMEFCDQTSASFVFDSVKYNMIVYPEYGLSPAYKGKVIFEIGDSLHNETQVFENNQYAHLSDLYYKVTCSPDGRTLSFNLDTNALEKGSTQINMPAIPFGAVTMKGDSILFPKDYRGKYILLDFWSTSCPHCIDDIRGVYKDLYKKYGGDKFEIIGVADDPKDRVKKFIAQNMISWTMIPAPKSHIQRSYRIDAYPALYFLNPEGVIIAKGQDLRKEKIYTVVEKYLGSE